jgi:hypothetical protein
MDAKNFEAYFFQNYMMRMMMILLTHLTRTSSALFIGLTTFCDSSGILHNSFLNGDEQMCLMIENFAVMGISFSHFSYSGVANDNLFCLSFFSFLYAAFLWYCCIALCEFYRLHYLSTQSLGATLSIVYQPIKPSLLHQTWIPTLKIT